MLRERKDVREKLWSILADALPLIKDAREDVRTTALGQSMTYLAVLALPVEEPGYCNASEHISGSLNL